LSALQWIAAMDIVRQKGSPPGHGMLRAVMPRMPQMQVFAWTFCFRMPDIDAAAAQVGASARYDRPGTDRNPRRQLIAGRRRPEGGRVWPGWQPEKVSHDRKEHTLPLV
jgi:hypothetical protein